MTDLFGTWATEMPLLMRKWDSCPRAAKRPCGVVLVPLPGDVWMGRYLPSSLGSERGVGTGRGPQPTAAKASNGGVQGKGHGLGSRRSPGRGVGKWRPGGDERRGLQVHRALAGALVQLSPVPDHCRGSCPHRPPPGLSHSRLRSQGLSLASACPANLHVGFHHPFCARHTSVRASTAPKVSHTHLCHKSASV